LNWPSGSRCSRSLVLDPLGGDRQAARAQRGDASTIVRLSGSCGMADTKLRSILMRSKGSLRSCGLE
jgi:hypothetical protein